MGGRRSRGTGNREQGTERGDGVDEERSEAAVSHWPCGASSADCSCHPGVRLVCSATSGRKDRVLRASVLPPHHARTAWWGPRLWAVFAVVAAVHGTGFVCLQADLIFDTKRFSTLAISRQKRVFWPLRGRRNGQARPMERKGPRAGIRSEMKSLVLFGRKVKKTA